jgi:hypothetical protein
MGLRGRSHVIMKRIDWRNLLAVGLLVFGFSQMLGDLTGNRILKGLGAASVVAPSPKVFCDINGVEPFASTFTVTICDRETKVGVITPEIYRSLRGPYNRRNVYGAAIAGAPLLPERLRQQVLGYAFAPNGPLGQQLPITSGANVWLDVRSNTRGRTQHWRFSCNP